MSEHDRAVIDAADYWLTHYSMSGGPTDIRYAEKLTHAVRARREAMKPEPRYRVVFGTYEVGPGRWDREWCVFDGECPTATARCFAQADAERIAAALNAAHEAGK